MSFFKNLTKKNSTSSVTSPLPASSSAASAPSSASPRGGSLDATAEADLVASIPSPTERGDESEAEPDPADGGAADAAAAFATEAKACAAQRLGVIPHMRTVTWGAYTEDNLCDIVVRGPTYLQDKKKVACGAPLFRLAHADVFLTKKDEPRILDVTTREGCYADLAYTRRTTQADVAVPAHITHPLSAMLIINIVFPGPNNCTMNLVQYYERRVPPADVLASMQQAARESGSTLLFGDETLAGVEIDRVAAFDRVYQRFIEGTDAHRDGCVKIIPRVVEGGWVVRKTVGRVPAILGKKVKQTYILNRERNLFQVTADIGTSNVAGKIITLIKSKCKSLVVDLSFLLQSDQVDELPESLIGGMRVSHCDLDRVLPFEENKVKNAPTFA